jgi:hypothetical protein
VCSSILKSASRFRSRTTFGSRRTIDSRSSQIELSTYALMIHALASLRPGSYDLYRIRVEFPWTSVERFERFRRRLCGLGNAFGVIDDNSLLQTLEWMAIGAGRLPYANLVEDGEIPLTSAPQLFRFTALSERALINYDRQPALLRSLPDPQPRRRIA